MKLEYLKMVAYQRTIQKHAFLLSMEDEIETIKKEKNVYLFGTGTEGTLAKYILAESNIKISGHIDNFNGNIGKCLGNEKIRRSYDYYKNKDGYVIIAVPRQHINYVRLQLMIYEIERYSIFFIEDFHSFINETEELHKMIMSGINLIGLDGREILDAIPYVQISSGLDGAKLGIINYLIYSTTWSHYVYQWLFEQYNHCQAPLSVLEVGPGHGLLSNTLKMIAHNIDLDWIVFDSKDIIRRESNENYNRSLDKVAEQYQEDTVHLYKGYIESDEYKITKKYDIIIMTEVFEHLVANPLETLKKLADALNAEGQMYITTPNWGHLYMYDSWKEMKIYKEIGSEKKYLDMYAGHTYQYDKSELDEIFEMVGLKIVDYKLSDANNHNYRLKK